MTGLISYTHPWLFGLGFAAFMAVAIEAGFRLGRNAPASEDQQVNIHAVEAAMLVILALLLGFTMSMAVSRFETRRQLILDEANAIEVSHLRAQLQPAPEGPEIDRLLRQYVDSRMVYFGAGTTDEPLRAARAENARFQEAIWLHVTTLAQKDNRSVPAGLLIQSLNNAFDLEAAGWTQFISHVPETVVLLNVAVSLLTGVLVGYSFGLSRHRHVFSACMLAVSITIVLGAIVDLDQPRGGFIRVSRQPMVDLQKRLSSSGH